jgi:hypothetical protein
MANQQTEQKRRNRDSNQPEQKRMAGKGSAGHDRSDEQMRHKKDRKIDRETGAETADPRASD